MKIDPNALPHIAILEWSQNFINQDKSPFTQIEPDDAICLVQARFGAFLFYFNILEVRLQDQNLIAKIEVFPHEQDKVLKKEEPASNIPAIYDQWKKLVERYTKNNIFKKSISPVEEQYIKDSYVEFEVVEEEDSGNVYDMKIQRMIDQYLDYAIKKIETYKTEETPEDKLHEIESIIDTAKELQETQTQLTENQFKKAYSKFEAKVRRFGVKMYEDIKTELFKELIKRGVKGILDNPQGSIDFLSGLLDS